MYEGRGSMHLFPFPKDIDVYKWGLLYNLRPILKIDKGWRGGGKGLYSRYLLDTPLFDRFINLLIQDNFFKCICRL